MDTSSQQQGAGGADGYANTTADSQQQQEDCSILSPTLADILSDDRILRFYQCVKDIKTQGSPKQTGSMFFALCHALGDTVSFLKVPNMSKIMFRQEQQIFAVNVAGTQHDTVIFQQQHQSQDQLQQSQLQHHQPPHPQQQQQDGSSLEPMKMAGTAAGIMHDVDSTHSSNLFSAAAADGSPQHLLQAALASVTAPHVEPRPAPAATSKRKNNAENKDGTKRAKKASPRDKEYAVRRNEVIQDLLKVSEADLMHQANIVEGEVKLIIQGHERSTKFGMLPPIHRFSAFANLLAHYDCDFAPKNAGVYYNYEYFQLYLAYRDLEAERQQQQQMEGGDPRPILVQCRSEIEKVLVNTNWEAIRRRLTIGERICQVCGVVGRGFLLLSKQVSGRKLLHNFNTGEWGEFMREFQKPENQTLLQTLQNKYSPERFYGPRQEFVAADDTNEMIERMMIKPPLQSAAASTSAAAMPTMDSVVASSSNAATSPVPTAMPSESPLVDAALLSAKLEQVDRSESPDNATVAASIAAVVGTPVTENASAVATPSSTAAAE
ncbi:Transcription initiation factor IIF subunit beta [Mucor velutinosus]|uniref:Transcription initiation factor IIF subunit beta n=1 Tax=Mucor velutinosus TaxID=708070 RepID=A0AAN7DSL5_9FUNG|nr:Transcription initiation factor IIF subunit beta [Mucor velutinosus]